MRFTTTTPLDIFDAITNVLPHASSPKDALPVLASLKVTLAGGDLRVVATDRYTLGITDLQVHGETDGEFLLPVDDAKELAKIAKKASTLVLEVEGNLLVTADGLLVRSFALLSQDDHTFPKYQRLLPSGEPVDVGVIGLGTGNLAKFTKIVRRGKKIKNATLKTTFYGPTKPADIRVPDLDGFRAIVMPVRLGAS